MRNASDRQGEINGGGKKVNKNTQDISSIKRVTRKLLEMYKKSVMHVHS